MTSKTASILVASVTYNQAPVSPLFHHTVSSLAKRATQLAQARLTPHASESEALPLSGSEDKNYDFVAKLSEAYQCLETEENKAAWGLFKETLDQFKVANLDKDYLVKLHCYLGLAYADINTRHLSVSNALQALKVVEANNQGWCGLEPELKSKHFLELLSCYKLLLALIPPEQIGTRQEISDKIDTYNIYLSQMDYIEELVREADRCVERKEPEKARQLYKKAHQYQTPTPLVTIATVSCELKSAETYRDNSFDREAPLGRARQLLNQLISERRELSKKLGWSEEKLAETLAPLFIKLLALLPKNDGHRAEIQKQLDTCMSELPKTNFKQNIPPITKSVTRGFSGSPATTRTFVVVIMILALIGAFTLSQRKVNSLDLK